MLPRSIEQKAKIPFCFPNVYHGPLEDIPGDKVGRFTHILPYTMSSAEHIPTSQIGFSAYLIPSREDIIYHNMVTCYCGWSDHPSCHSNASGTSFALCGLSRVDHVPRTYRHFQIIRPVQVGFPGPFWPCCSRQVCSPPPLAGPQSSNRGSDTLLRVSKGAQRWLLQLWGVFNRGIWVHLSGHDVPSQHAFWGKMITFVAVLAKNTSALGCRLDKHQHKINIRSCVRVTKHSMGTRNVFLALPHYFLPIKIIFPGRNYYFCCHSGQKHKSVSGCRL